VLVGGHDPIPRGGNHAQNHRHHCPVDRRDTAPNQGETAVLLDERVYSVHLTDDHAAEQLIERLAWAVNDAEDTQRALTAH
jgi:hypothetical protein